MVYIGEENYFRNPRRKTNKTIYMYRLEDTSGAAMDKAKQKCKYKTKIYNYFHKK